MGRGALAGAAAGALLLVAVGGPAPPPPRPPGDDRMPAARPAAPAPGQWRPVRLPVPADAALSRYAILLQDDTSGVYFEPEAPDRAP